MAIVHSLSRSFVALLFLCALPGRAFAQVPDFAALYVFGDSLVDSGNVFLLTKALGVEPAIPPSESPNQTYFGGRFSNGPVAVEYLWERLSGNAPGSPLGMKAFLSMPFRVDPGGLNFAYGGTGTPFLDQTPGGFWAPGLKGQITLFGLALRGKKPPRALYVIATGPNDYRNDPFNTPMDPEAVVGNIIESIVGLYRLGARDVMVLDMPDLGLIPANGEDPGPPTQLTLVHNQILTRELGKLQAKYPSLHLMPVRLEPLFLSLIGRLESRVPALAALGPEGSFACLFVDPALCQDVPSFLFKNVSLGFLFWDIVHPTTEAHKNLGDYLYEQLAASYR
jgi:phospholipase/lecithinase/hemolysin